MRRRRHFGWIGRSTLGNADALKAISSPGPATEICTLFAAAVGADGYGCHWSDALSFGPWRSAGRLLATMGLVRVRKPRGVHRCGGG